MFISLNFDLDGNLGIPNIMEYILDSEGSK